MYASVIAFKQKQPIIVLKIVVILIFSVAHACAFLKYFSAAERTKFNALMENTGIVKEEQKRIENKILTLDSGSGQRLEIMRYLTKGLRRPEGDTLTWDKVNEHNEPIDASQLPPVPIKSAKPVKNVPPPKNLATDFIDAILNLANYRMPIAEAIAGEREPGPELGSVANPTTGEITPIANPDYFALINNAMTMKDRIALVNLFKVADGTKIPVIKVILFNIFKNHPDQQQRSKIIHTLYALNVKALQEKLIRFNMLKVSMDYVQALNMLRAEALDIYLKSKIFESLLSGLESQIVDESFSKIIVYDPVVQKAIIENLRKLTAFLPLDNPQHNTLKQNLMALFATLAPKVPSNIDNLINVVSHQLGAKTWATKQKIIIVQGIADMTVSVRNRIGTQGERTIRTYKDKPGQELRQAIDSLLKKYGSTEMSTEEFAILADEEEVEEEAALTALKNPDNGRKNRTAVQKGIRSPHPQPIAG